MATMSSFAAVLKSVASHPLVKETRRFWRKSMPRAAAAASVPPFLLALAPLFAIIALSLILYAQLQLLMGLTGVRAHSRTAKVRATYGLVSSCIALVIFLVETWALLADSTLVNTLLQQPPPPPPSAASLKVGVRLVASWACGFHFLAVETLLTLAACAPLLLRCLTPVPALRRLVYPPAVPAPTPAGAPGSHEGEQPVPEPPAPSLGAAVESLRALDASDAICTRLVIAAVLWGLARYGPAAL